MRLALKFLHSCSSAGLIGGLLAYMLVLLKAPRDTASQYVDMRATIEAICNLMLIPSLGLALVSGLLAMAVHRPFQEKRWAWVKALLGIGMFEATLALTQSKAHTAADLARKIAAGEAQPDALLEAIHSEWMTLWAILTISLANVALGVWRPRLKSREAQKEVAPQRGN